MDDDLLRLTSVENNLKMSDNEVMSSSSEKIQTQCSSARRVLVVDDDLPLLKSLEDNLKTCGYDVITCTSTQDALHLINEKKHGVDMVLCDLNMASLNGFEFLKHACQEVPVIATYNMQEDTSMTLKVLQQCACCYILKSAIPQWLRNLQQCVFERRSKEVVNDIEKNQAATVTSEETQMINSNETEPQCNEGPRPVEDMNHDTVNEFEDPNTTDSRRKRKLLWLPELHKKFVDAVNEIGLDKAKPKKIHELMNVPGLTRANVASHLQKYKAKRPQIENDKQNHNDVGMQQKLTTNEDTAPQERVTMLSQDHYTAGINMQQHNNIAMTASEGRVVQILEQNQAPYVGETQNHNSVGINYIQNPSRPFSVQPQYPVTTVESAPQGPVSVANNDELGRNGWDNLTGHSGYDFAGVPTLDDLESLMEAEHLFNFGNQEQTDETQMPDGW